MARTEYLGARASNAGDSFHELWALHAALELLKTRTTLIGVTVEGLPASDSTDTNSDAWDGVDCGLYFDGDSLLSASRVELIQLKYSSADSSKNWTVAGLTASTSKNGNNSVIRRLANQFVAAYAQRNGNPDQKTVAKLVTNRPIASEVIEALRSLTLKVTKKGSSQSRNEKNLEKIRAASGLRAKDFAAFCGSLVLHGAANSRFALKEDLLLSIGKWTNTSSRTQLDDLLQFVREQMMPESRQDLIRRESVLARFGISDRKSLFPCPPELKEVEKPIPRSQAKQVIEAISRGAQRVCLHGEGGSGKTTLLQEIRSLLPAQSEGIVFDCYGGGTYLYSNAYRHRESDAFTQLTNEAAAALGAPLFLLPAAQTDYPRVFMERLAEAARLQTLVDSHSLLLVAIDAADNAVSAAKACKPPEESFISSVAALGVLPPNVVLIITARTGRLDSLALPPNFERIPVSLFSLSETTVHVTNEWPGVSDEWIQEFHHLSSHNPRVQRYALDAGRRGGKLSDTLNYLLPAGKGLNDVFRQQIRDAIVKAGSDIDVQKFCSAVVALPRPIPVDVFAAVTQLSKPHIADICSDLAPGIVFSNGELSLADEDFEGFLDQESRSLIETTRVAAAVHLWNTRNTTTYAATHVATLLLDSDRGNDLVTLLQTEKEPEIITDPVLRREVQLQRLKLGIRICDDLNAPVDAVKTLIIGTEAINTNDVIKRRLERNPDLAAACSAERASTLVLRDPEAYQYHGGLLFHLYLHDARAGHLLQARARQRQLNAWMKRRSSALKSRDSDLHHQEKWPIETRDIAAGIEADLFLHGAYHAIRSLRSWSPRLMLPGVLSTVTESLLSNGRHDLAIQMYSSDVLLDAWKVFVFVPCALAGLPIPQASLVRGISSLARRSSGVIRNRSRGIHEDNAFDALPESLLRACEIAVAQGCPIAQIENVLALYEDPLQRSRARFSPYDSRSLDRTLRALSLRIRAGQRTLDSATFWITPKDHQAEKERQSDERTREQDAYVASLCKAYSDRADLLLGTVTQSDFAASIRSMEGSGSLNNYEIRQQYETGRLRAQFAASLTVLLSVDGMDGARLSQAAISVIGSQARYATEEHLHALGPFRNRPALQEALLAQVHSWTGDLAGRKIPASERIDSMIRLARYVLGMSTASAGAMFIRSLDFASDIDEDVLLQIQVLRSLSEAAAPRLTVERRNERGRDLICVATDAILRLDDVREFDWKKFAQGLTQLNLSLGLVAAARWEDYGILRRDQLLPAIIRQGLAAKQMTVSQAVAIVTLVDDDDSKLLALILDANRDGSNAGRAGVAEILAWDDLFRFGKGHSDNLAKNLVDQGYVSEGATWVKSLTETASFLALINQPELQSSSFLSAESLELDDWNEPLSFDSAEDLHEAIQKAEREAERRGGHLRHSTDYIFDSVFRRVPVGKRGNVLYALSDLYTSQRQYSADNQLVRVIHRWAPDPAVEQWCTSELPEFLRNNLLRLGQWVRYGQSTIHELLRVTQLSSRAMIDLILSGVALNAEGLHASLALPLVELMATSLEADDAVVLSEWYSGRLVHHIPAPERDLIDATDVPIDTATGVARYLYALMTDVDTRIRWRAAHALRRLAVLKDVPTIEAFGPQMTRMRDDLYRQSDAPFYELGGRLWFALAAERASAESPNCIGVLAGHIRSMVDSTSTPHVLIKAFARSALEKLDQAGEISLSRSERAELSRVNKSPMAKMARANVKPPAPGMKRETKHRFDLMDTIPYWYEPVVECFADVSMDEFLGIADKWISNVWGVAPDIGVWRDEKRLNRYPEREWGLWSNSHGSEPVIERPATYYEWHAMWCSAGELLATRRLATDREGWTSRSLDRRIRRAMLSDLTRWLFSLRTPKPLEKRFWYGPPHKEHVESWISDDDTACFLGEIGVAADSPFVVVDGRHETQADWFRSDVNLRSALVTPARSLSLLRALESADHYRYLVPPEDHNLEINRDGYQLVGWLKSVEHEGEGIEDNDTFRASIRAYEYLPGTAVTQYFKLEKRISDQGLIVGQNDEIVFQSEIWSDEIEQNDRRHRYGQRPVSTGQRLKMDRGRLAEFLTSQGLDLIVHVQETRANRGYGYGESCDKEKKQVHNRHFVLRADRSYEDALGHIGTW